jgi:hypothetical protein
VTAPASAARGRALAITVSSLLALATALLARPPEVVRIEAGGAGGGLLGAGFSESNRTSLDPEVAALDPPAAQLLEQFRFRAASPGSVIDLPVGTRSGSLRLTLRAMARVRTEVSFHVDGRKAAEIVIPRGPWERYTVELPPAGDGDGARATLTLQPQPLVRVPDEYVQRPVVWLSELEAEAPGGLRFSREARALLAAAPIAVALFGLAVGFSPAAMAGAAGLAAAIVLALARTAPAPLLLAIPRLLLPALAAGLLARLALTAPDIPPRARAALCALVAAGVFFHGTLPFVPGYDPYDVEVHVRRARDLGTVPFEYDALLRYGSHLPTPTQTFGTATAALGERTLIPYSPLPYVAYYALHRLGAELLWSMIVLDTILAMLIVPLLWRVVARLFDEGSAWVAALLYALDLPVWHHLARAHVPASFGCALATAALLWLVLKAGQLDTPKRVAGAAGALALAALGYSSLVVLLGLFGLVLLALLALDASALSPAAKRGLAVSLAAGGAVAGLVFYFHFVPGLLHGVGPLQSEPDPFQPRTYFIFHNESRQSMRVWAAGFAIPLLAGLIAAPVALRRAAPDARPVLTAWLLTWPLVMLAKEPFLFPRPLRWAKEDQFIAPLLALLIGAACWALPKAWMRWAAAAVAVAVALYLQLGDFRIHFTGAMP